MLPPTSPGGQFLTAPPAPGANFDQPTTLPLPQTYHFTPGVLRYNTPPPTSPGGLFLTAPPAPGANLDQPTALQHPPNYHFTPGGPLLF